MELFDTNTFAIVRICKAVVPIMAKRVNIGSIMGNISSPWSGVYCASKAALNSISEVLYMELKPFGIHVLHVAAGGVKSNIATNSLNLLSLQETLYGQFVHNRVNASQDSASIPNEEFAKKVVTSTLKTNPHRYMTLGGYLLMFSILWWLPRGLYLFWKRFSKSLTITNIM